jgi:hypothetical protein
MKSDRVFFSTAAAINLLIMLVGFSAFYTSGRAEGGRAVDPAIMAVVIVHGMSITAWYVLSLVQSLLITVKNRKLHMKLGWSALALAPIVAVSGLMVAMRSAQAAPNFNFFGMHYHDFLLVMLVEIALFSGLVTAGMVMRKRPEIHRSMMLLASLSLLLGATTRIPKLVALFGGHASRTAFFGPVFVLAVVMILTRWAATRKFDRWLAGGYTLMVAVYLVSEQCSRTDAWRQIATMLLKP